MATNMRYLNGSNTDESSITTNATPNASVVVRRTPDEMDANRGRERHPDAPRPPGNHPTAVRGLDPETGRAVWIDFGEDGGAEIVGPVVLPDGTLPDREPGAVGNRESAATATEPDRESPPGAIETAIGSDRLATLASVNPGRLGKLAGLDIGADRDTEANTEPDRESPTTESHRRASPVTGTLTALSPVKGVGSTDDTDANTESDTESNEDTERVGPDRVGAPTLAAYREAHADAESTDGEGDR
ncbi:hypothetical protein HacjB3_19623 (plasmid) [Halalkalicoccus jeotgali B3]|uniref:Uncharacterized protein n=3 Tax=Halalkalicoccus jeotgali TaxID=413810 RepID=D8JDA7_HALJB|nr:hypothetical protein HacjB3_19623 [Halalkalicoccus jeotgali B3]